MSSFCSAAFGSQMHKCINPWEAMLHRFCFLLFLPFACKKRTTL